MAVGDDIPVFRSYNSAALIGAGIPFGIGDGGNNTHHRGGNLTVYIPGNQCVAGRCRGNFDSAPFAGVRNRGGTALRLRIRSLAGRLILGRTGGIFQQRRHGRIAKNSGIGRISHETHDQHSCQQTDNSQIEFLLLSGFGPGRFRRVGNAPSAAHRRITGRLLRWVIGRCIRRRIRTGRIGAIVSVVLRRYRLLMVPRVRMLRLRGLLVVPWVCILRLCGLLIVP